jgi:hypothetical protein
VRTTLDIDDDVLLVVKERARRERRSAGAVVSELARRALAGGPLEGAPPSLGFHTIPRRDAVVTTSLVDELLDESGE